MTKTEQAKRDIHSIVQDSDLSRRMEKARQESGLAVHPFYSILKETLVNLATSDQTMDEIRHAFDETFDIDEYLDNLEIDEYSD